MFCSKCGSPNSEGSLFCKKCGAKLAVDETAEQISNESALSTLPMPELETVETATQTAKDATVGNEVIIHGYHESCGYKRKIKVFRNGEFIGKVGQGETITVPNDTDGIFLFKSSFFNTQYTVNSGSNELQLEWGFCRLKVFDLSSDESLENLERTRKNNKKWEMANSILVGIVTIMMLIGYFMSDGGTNHAQLVYSNHPFEDEGITATYKMVIDEYFTAPKWVERRDNDDVWYVDVSGQIAVDGEESDITLTFKVTPEGNKYFTNTFSIKPYSIEIGGESENSERATKFISELFDAYSQSYENLNDYYIKMSENAKATYVKLVKEGTFSAYPQKPIGSAFDNFMSSIKWESGETEEGQKFVNVRGKINYGEKEVEAAVQFFVDLKAESFEYQACEFDGVPQSQSIFMMLLEKIMESYTVPTITPVQSKHVNTSSSQTNTQSEEEVLQLYILYINEVRKEASWNDENGQISLIHINNDDIPELIIDWASTVGGTEIWTISNGELIGVHVDANGISYIERQNIFVGTGGGMGQFHDIVYTITDGEFKVLHTGNNGEDEEATNDEENSYTIQYYWRWDGKDVTESEYQKNLRSVFDASKAISSSANAYSAVDMLQKINELLQAHGFQPIQINDASSQVDVQTDANSAPQASADFDLLLARVTGNNVNVRSAPNMQGKVLLQIKNPEDELFVVYQLPVKDNSGDDWYRVLWRWFSENELEEDSEDTFDSVDVPAYINGRFLAIEPLSPELREYLVYYWETRDKEDIINYIPRQTQNNSQQRNNQPAQVKAPQGIYSDVMGGAVYHFERDQVAVYTFGGLPLGTWKVKVDGNILYFTKMQKQNKDAHFYFKWDGDVLMMKGNDEDSNYVQYHRQFTAPAWLDLNKFIR